MKEYSKFTHNKLGLELTSVETAILSNIINTWLDMLASEKQDYSISFKQLCQFDIHAEHQALRDKLVKREQFDAWTK